VYVDTASDGPAFATVRIGMIGRHRLVFVPLVGAGVCPDALRVQFDKKLVGDGPSIDTDGELSADAERRCSSTTGCLPGTTGSAASLDGDPVDEDERRYPPGTKTVDAFPPAVSL
jgi:hypothetical protein